MCCVYGIWVTNKFNISRGPFCRLVVWCVRACVCVCALQLIRWWCILALAAFNSISHSIIIIMVRIAQSDGINFCFLIHENNECTSEQVIFHRCQHTAYTQIYPNLYVGVSSSNNLVVVVVWTIQQKKIESTTPRAVCVCWARYRLNNWNGNRVFLRFAFVRDFPIFPLFVTLLSWRVHTINNPLLIFVFFLCSSLLVYRHRCGGLHAENVNSFQLLSLISAYWIRSELKSGKLNHGLIEE